jgi:hypothetical protein
MSSRGFLRAQGKLAVLIADAGCSAGDQDGIEAAEDLPDPL